MKQREDIDYFYTAIIHALKISARHCIPSSIVSTKSYIVPGWNEYVKEHHIHVHAKDVIWLWNLNNRPRHGLINIRQHEKNQGSFQDGSPNKNFNNNNLFNQTIPIYCDDIAIIIGG